jgi:hypothetical protein
MKMNRLLVLVVFSALSLGACTDDGATSGPPDAHVAMGPDGGADASIPGAPDAMPPPPSHACKGTPAACADLTSTFCGTQHGCIGDPDRCGGVSFSCSSFFSSSSCSLQPGCFWAFSSNFCEGFAEECSSQPGISSCDGIQGCNWTFGTCSGEVSPCSTSSDELSCNEQLGCFWE